MKKLNHRINFNKKSALASIILPNLAIQFISCNSYTTS